MNCFLVHIVVSTVLWDCPRSSAIHWMIHSNNRVFLLHWVSFFSLSFFVYCISVCDIPVPGSCWILFRILLSLFIMIFIEHSRRSRSLFLCLDLSMKDLWRETRQVDVVNPWFSTQLTQQVKLKMPLGQLSCSPSQRYSLCSSLEGEGEGETDVNVSRWMPQLPPQAAPSLLRCLRDDNR